MLPGFVGAWYGKGGGGGMGKNKTRGGEPQGYFLN